VLESELQSAPENDAAIAKLIQDKIHQMAPNDLLGTVVSRLIARKLDPMNNLKIQDNSPILFNGIIRRIDKMVADAETLSDESQWPDFWQRMFFESMEATGRRSGEQDFRKIFTNDVYVVEILMNLMFYYSNQ